MAKHDRGRNVYILSSSCAYWAIVEKVIFLPIKKQLVHPVPCTISYLFDKEFSQMLLNVTSVTVELPIAEVKLWEKK